MKNFIKNWIVNLIKDTYPKIKPFDYSEVDKKIEDVLKQYNISGECVNCQKVIVGHYGGFYKNFKGQLFCSHECIDDYKLKDN